MATVASESQNYPTSDGRPMAETDLHRDLMVLLIHRLQSRYVDNDMVYVSGNLLLFYEPGNKRRHLSPDVFVVNGVPKHPRLNYLIWEEGKGPDFVIEVTSSKTRKEDQKKKFALYQDVLKVPEYFLFNPKGDYLKPLLQGYRLQGSEYQAIKPAGGRLRSEELGLELIQEGADLKLYDFIAKQWVLAPEERVEFETRARQEAELGRQQAEQARQLEAAARKRAEAEVEQLRREIEALRRQGNST